MQSASERLIRHPCQDGSSAVVAIYAAFFTPFVGGYIKNTAELATRLVRRGWQVIVIAGGQSDSEDDYDSRYPFPVYRIATAYILGRGFPVPLPSLSNLRTFVKFLRSSYHMIHVVQTRFFFLSVIGALIASLRQEPLALLERGSDHVISHSRLISLLSRLYDHTLGSWLAKSADLVVGISFASRRFLRHLGVRDAKVIPNGIDIPAFISEPSSVEESAPSRTVRIGFAGRLVYLKGLEDLVGAYQFLDPELKSRSELIIIGDGPLFRKMQELAAVQRITLVGSLSGRRYWESLNECDIIVNPSYSEGLPTCVLEGMALGKAVIASDVGGTGEIVTHGETGFLFRPGDRQSLGRFLEILVRDHKLRYQIGRSAREYVMANFSWDRVVESWSRELSYLEPF